LSPLNEKNAREKGDLQTFANMTPELQILDALPQNNFSAAKRLEGKQHEIAHEKTLRYLGS
jgi:hypothetical protein